MPRFTFSPSGHRPVAAARLALLSTLIFVGLSGCGGGGGSVTPSISVFASGAASTVDGHDTDLITAVVANDTSNAGVTWGAPSIGSLSSLSSLTPTYTAPAATTAQQTVSLTATSVTDKSKSYTVTLTIPPAPAITTASLPAASALAAYSTTLAGSGGIGPYTWTLTGGTLPTGFSLSTTGVLSAAAGTTAPTSATNLTFKLTDSGSPTALTASTTLSLTVGPPNAPVAGSVVYDNFCSNDVAGPTTTVSINTTPTATTTTTDSNGNFSFASIPYGSYTITPSLAGSNAVFSPSTQNVTVNAGGTVVAFQAAVGYSVSGAASYPTGSATGPVHLILEGRCTFGSTGANWTNDILGTTIATTGNYTINGVPPGSYTVKAWRDAAGNNWPNASDPTGTSTVQTVTNGNLTGVNVTMTDPTPPTFTNTPGTPAVYPIDKGVVLSAQELNVANNSIPSFWNNIIVLLETATSYNVEWGTDQTFATYTGSKNFPAKGAGNTWILTGLKNNAQLYFRYQGVLGSATSPWSTASSLITVGEATTGAANVTGTATFTNAAAGPMYIEFQNLSTNQIYYTSIASPASPQRYSIYLPAIGNYSVTAFIDQNNDNIYDGGDMFAAGGAYNVAVTGATATHNFPMIGGGISNLTGGITNYQEVNYNLGATRQFYNIAGVALSGSREVTAMELTSGPNVVVPVDFNMCGWETQTIPFCSGPYFVANTPQVGDMYDFKLTYSDGTSETIPLTLASVPGSFGANPSPSGIGANLTPTISWTDPPNASDYNYTFSFSGGIPRESWNIPAQDYSGTFTSSTDSLTWGTDPAGGGNVPSPASLSATGGEYGWTVSGTDSYGNGSTLEVGYYLGWNHVMLPAPNATSLSAATVGHVYSGTIVASNGSASDYFVVTGLSDGLTYSSNAGTLTIGGTPLAAGTITFNVFVIDNVNYYWGPVPYTITVNN